MRSSELYSYVVIYPFLGAESGAVSENVTGIGIRSRSSWWCKPAVTRVGARFRASRRSPHTASWWFSLFCTDWLLSRSVVCHPASSRQHWQLRCINLVDTYVAVWEHVWEACKVDAWQMACYMCASWGCEERRGLLFGDRSETRRCQKACFRFFLNNERWKMNVEQINF